MFGEHNIKNRDAYGDDDDYEDDDGEVMMLMIYMGKNFKKWKMRKIDFLR